MRWSDAVRRADFEVYGIVQPSPARRWAGSYGADGSSATTDLGVLHDIDGAFVEVNTLSSRNRIPPDHRLRLRIGRLLPGVVESTGGSIELPLRLQIDILPTERSIAVDGETTDFSCVTVGGHGWAGEATMGDGSIVEIFASEEVPGLTLTSLRELDLLGLAV
ncbi:MAG: hypothetical protein GY926_18520 [bacterium]|nr:hypothetical protein [bacterium]